MFMIIKVMFILCGLCRNKFNCISRKQINAGADVMCLASIKRLLSVVLSDGIKETIGQWNIWKPFGVFMFLSSKKNSYTC